MKQFLFMVFSLGLYVNTCHAQVNQTFELTGMATEKIMAQAIKYAKENNAPGASIAIVDAGGHLLRFYRMDGTFPSSAPVSIEKAHTAAVFKANTVKLEDAINNGRVALTTVGYNFLKGGMPIIYKGQVIGGIGVSGASSADQDLEIAKAGASTSLE